MEHVEYREMLVAIARPLQFVSRNNFENLARVKDLENTLARAAGRAIEHAPSQEIVEQLHAFLKALPAPNAPTPKRVSTLRSSLTQIENLLQQGLPVAKVPLENITPAAKSIPRRKPVSAPKTAVPKKNPALEPTSLRPDTPIQFVKGVGPKTAQAFSFRNIEIVEDLLRFLPRRYENRQTGVAIGELEHGASATVEGEVVAKDFRRMRGKRTLDVVLRDETGHLYLKWFRVPGGSFVDRFKKGAWVEASGTVARYRGKLQIVHPETRVLGAATPRISAGQDGAIISGYLEVEGVRPATLRTILERALACVHLIADRLPGALRERHGFHPLGECLHHLHQPPPTTSLEALQEMNTPWHRRLIYEELFMLQLVVLRRKAHAAQNEALTIAAGASASQIATEMFDFELTGAQLRCLEQIETDLSSTTPMNRLLQGDVGSGKTAVALAAAVMAARAGFQSALMVPTELLAEQHARGAQKLLPQLGVRVGLLTGKLGAAEKRSVLEDLELGRIDLVIGTHALIQDGVKFKRLALGIVDEQHRFGVMQRAKFLDHGQASTGCIPHILVMTATPIPRTLALTVYGDLDVSVIDELPPGRTPVTTRLHKEQGRQRVYERVREAVAQGQQAYVVLPLVEESDKEGMDRIRDATSTHEELQHGLLAGLRLGLVHGKLGSDEKDCLMRAFAEHRLDVLVATTVIEVGIDVPNASIMVVEHAERFGLSQLHQLRGRVGRGAARSECLLIARPTQSEDTWRRLAIMEETTDGFRIAEEDLEIRGPGDFVGTRQSGLPVLCIANLARDQKILLRARDDAREILQRDPELLEDDHQGVRAWLFNVWQDRLSLAKIG